MKILGLTGGIGSGKTVVANLLNVMGIPVYDSDSRSKQLCDSDATLIASLKKLFGDDIYTEGRLNRAMLAKVIFNNPVALNSANALIHPAVECDFRNWLAERTASPIAVQETAIIFESGLEKHFDYILCVTAPEELRISRVCKRSEMCVKEVTGRIKNQIADEERMKRSDFILNNDDKNALIPQVEQIIETILNNHTN